jgi:hypothetical protein
MLLIAEQSCECLIQLFIISLPLFTSLLALLGVNSDSLGDNNAGYMLPEIRARHSLYNYVYTIYNTAALPFVDVDGSVFVSLHNLEP